ncbi:MAG: undecaprenyl-diphosphatase UppP [Solirubrobacterales bacterium]|nr:undecaprenyl-diphosphatase UppP [Solirubrobacterales bacterium]
MSELEALLLGIVQGLTEFLPISSSGHLILVPWLQDYRFLIDHPDFNRTFDVALHAGTLVAAVAYFRKDVGPIISAFVRSLRRREITEPEERLAWLIAIGTVPAVLFGGLAGDFIDEHLAEPWLIGVNLIVFGIVLYLVDRLPESKGMDDVQPRDGIVIGVAQAFALIAGTSRSGITISAARLLRMDRDTAARVSFLLLIPAVFGATIYKAYKAVHDGLPPDVAGPMIVGMVAAAVSGYLAIAFLLRIIRTHSYSPFVVYRIAVGIFVLGLISTGVRSATF